MNDQPTQTAYIVLLRDLPTTVAVSPAAAQAAALADRTTPAADQYENRWDEYSSTEWRLMTRHRGRGGRWSWTQRAVRAVPLIQDEETEAAAPDALRRIHTDMVTAPVEVPAIDFYQPGHTYTSSTPSQHGWKFRCDTVTTHPETGGRTAIGWRFFCGEWEVYDYSEDDWRVQNFDEAGLVDVDSEDLAR